MILAAAMAPVDSAVNLRLSDRSGSAGAVFADEVLACKWSILV
jgi:hypothetical protein